MVSCGDPEDDIAAAIGIAKHTLRKYYLHELQTGRQSCHGRVKDTAFRLAVSGRCPAATFFWLKTQCQWREVNHIKLDLESIPTEKLIEILDAGNDDSSGED